jgi:hypothetical protein
MEGMAKKKRPSQEEREKKMKQASLAGRALAAMRKRPGRKASCGHDTPDPNCESCRQRLYRQQRRAEGKDNWYTPKKI